MIEDTEISLDCLSSLIFNANDIIFITDLNSKKVVYTNNMFLEKFEYTKEELSHLNILDIRKTNDNKPFSALIKDLEKTTNSITYAKYFSKSGKKYYLESSNKLQQINKKKYLVSIAREITDKLEKEFLIKEELNIKIAEIENQKIFLNTLLKNNPTAIFYKNIHGKYLGCNKAWEELTGIKEDEIVGKSVLDIAPKDIAKIYFEEDKKVFSLEESPQIYQAEVYNKTVDKRFDVVFYKSAYFDAKGEVLGLIGVVIDVTQVISLEKEKEKKEKIIYQQSKMAAMGEMIENIAHQWRQPLSTMTVSASGIKMQKEFGILKDESLSEFIEAILESSKHLSQTIDDFRNFFKTTKYEEVFNIKNTFNKTLVLLSSKFKNRNIKIEQDIQSIEIKSLQNELIHVILNILNNANDALEKLNIEEKIIFIKSKIDSTNKLKIKISDNAGGINENIIFKIFDPYFTTKHQSQGTGIGLYMTKEIVNKHLNGSIDVKNIDFNYKEKNYTGAEFTIILPL
ncbi:PAS domain S-box protein [Malaciobacter canalis]|uniref:sensor histidine kinase n=1 Tax=Malaciobacter canalis TaxID=1912871 RepID=UPI00384FF5CF